MNCSTPLFYLSATISSWSGELPSCLFLCFLQDTMISPTCLCHMGRVLSPSSTTRWHHLSMLVSLACPTKCSSPGGEVTRTFNTVDELTWHLHNLLKHKNIEMVPLVH